MFRIEKRLVEKERRNKHGGGYSVWDWEYTVYYGDNIITVATVKELEQLLKEVEKYV